MEQVIKLLSGANAEIQECVNNAMEKNNQEFVD
jgi:hypothetical protein